LLKAVEVFAALAAAWFILAGEDGEVEDGPFVFTGKVGNPRHVECCVDRQNRSVTLEADARACGKLILEACPVRPRRACDEGSDVLAVAAQADASVVREGAVSCSTGSDDVGVHRQGVAESGNESSFDVIGQISLAGSDSEETARSRGVVCDGHRCSLSRDDFIAADRLDSLLDKRTRRKRHDGDNRSDERDWTPE